ncbi:ATP-binding protein [Paenibacillus sp.]|uniref:ATP-binding protein n=1 Tax=Paenibacillus sp. TaxID=58172 RepID=UPI002D37F6D8|nr:ATP-binding protein [Paenibacillus sp.]HZG87683.1 ATP-binding protein [Paenibacillus sp.]
MTATNHPTASASPPTSGLHPPPAPGLAKPRKNRRTLRKRIVRNMHYLSFMNLLLFSLVLMALFVGLFRTVSYSLSNYFASSIAEDVTSPTILHSFGASTLSELDPDDPAANGWILERIERVTKYEQATWLYEVTNEDGRWGVEPKVMEDAIYVELLLHGETVYSNVPQMVRIQDESVSKLIEYYKTESVKPLVDESTGETHGTIKVGVNPLIPLALTFVIAVVLFGLFLIGLLLSKLVILLLTAPLIAPIAQLEQKVRAIADDDYESTLEAKIELKRPLREIESLMNSTNRIMDKMKRYADEQQRQKATLEEQYDELEAQHDELTRSKRQLQEAQALLTERERSVRNLLDNAKQGFLTFGPELLVDEEYSRECLRLYGEPIAGRPFPDMLASGDEEQRRFIASLLGKLFAERDPARRQVLLPLLPDETTVGQKHVQVEYAMIADRSAAGGAKEQCMVILTDVTEKKLLQSRMEQERNTLQMVVKVVVDYNQYASLARSFSEWCAAPFDAGVPDAEMKSALFDLFRTVHTFKGSFAQIGMSRMADRLHGVESTISAWSKRSDPPSAAEAADRLRELRMLSWLEEEQDVLRGVLGDAFFEQEHVLLVDRSKIMELERKMMATLSPADCSLLLPELRKIRYKPFRELLASYPDYVLGLSERFDKMVAPFDIEGGDFLVDGDAYLDLTRSLVHVFRNAVDHGLEGPDERLAAGKPEYGRIRCAVSLEGDTIELSVSDDGRGIDVGKLKRKAVELGVLSGGEADALGDEEAMLLAFHGELSSKDEVTEYSGRGVGLSALRYETERLGGEVAVRSTVGGGTVFTVTLPYDSLSRLPDVTPASLLLPIAETAAAFFESHAELGFTFGDVRAEVGGKMALRNFSTFMPVQGACNGMFVLTMDEPTADALTERLAYGELTPEEKRLYTEDTLAETANIVFGNSLRAMDALEAYLQIDPPITVFTQGASMKVAESEMWSVDLLGTAGGVGIGFIKM